MTVSNKNFKFSIVLGIAICLTVGLLWFTFWKGWMEEDAFFWAMSFVWPYVAFSYIGEYKPQVAALIIEFLMLVKQYLRGQLNAQQLLERIVILIKNAVMLANDLAGIKDPTVTNKLASDIDQAKPPTG